MATTMFTCPVDGEIVKKFRSFCKKTQEKAKKAGERKPRIQDITEAALVQYMKKGGK